MAVFHWSLYLGPCGVKVNPCKPGDFTLGSSTDEFDYNRDDINNPPNPPAMELPLPEWMGHKDCNWKTNGHGDVGQLICGDWMIYDCERDASWNDGAIACHGQVAIHLGTISATPVKYTGVRRSENGTGWRPTDYYDSSVQVLLLRSSGTEYYWQMYQGPALVSVDPCGYPDPFKVADNKGVYHYGRDAIGNAPQAPAISRDMPCASFFQIMDIRDG
ncbi:hypothetical protein BKA58DRAFT_445992 [Alternaria rosae]|uniref:uncharacterized protein n=1 Tax=Alternaria rosae TaxID=1187941 RepID=UPI001E8DCE95|nr:uncharacterized protein BKA58DRAFT_445992 [Alternaria rosae]KAH6881729.1 hypothetical protein BKA58DRAFT_445992 [Alternaria rosae]